MNMITTAGWEPAPGTDDRLNQIHAYWLSLAAPGGIPRASDFEPAAIAPLLPQVLVIDVLDRPRDFRFRVAGTAITQGIGYDVTGKFLVQVFPDQYYQEVFDDWASLIDARRAKWANGRMWIKERSFLKWQGLMMPMRGEGDTVTQMLGGGVFKMADE